MMCTQCQAININGTPCHETGCPNWWLQPWTNEPYDRECDWCGSKFKPEEKTDRFCDESCAISYSS